MVTGGAKALKLCSSVLAETVSTETFELLILMSPPYQLLRVVLAALTCVKYPIHELDQICLGIMQQYNTAPRYIRCNILKYIWCNISIWRNHHVTMALGGS